MYKIKKLKERIVLLSAIIFFVFFFNVDVIHAEESNYTTEESGENYITDYNEGYYDSYEEAASNNVAQINNDEDATSLYANPQVNENIVICDTIEDAAAYMRGCMVNRADEVVFIIKNNEKYNNNEELREIAVKLKDKIMEEVFVETDSVYEGDYLRWHYIRFDGRYDAVDGGLMYTLYPIYQSTAEQEKQVDEKVEELLNNEFYGWQEMSEFERVKRVYRWLTSNYSYVAGEDRHSTYSGIIENETVCQGFATSAYRILREMDISCRVVANSEHGWNIVKIGDYYYNIDATWDVGLIETEWNNFLLNNTNFEKIDMHTRGARYTTNEFNKNYPMTSSNYKWTPEKIGIEYKTHVQTYGWQSFVSNGATSGTEGEAKRLEAISVHLKNAECYNIDIEYMTHIQSYGWESDWMTSDSVSGSVGKGKRLEAIKLQLTGKMAGLYDVYYRVHVQTYGWLGWAKNGENAGSSGFGKRLEGIQIVVLPKGEKPEGVIGYSYIANGKTAMFDDNAEPKISYKTHVQSYGWQRYISDGSISGTFGEAKRLEGICIGVNTDYAGGVEYRTHVQTYGWEDEWKKDNEISGTEGQAKRLEAIQIRLYGQLEKHYDVYYRVHAQTYGWLGWVKNGETAGTEGLAKRLEAIQIVLLPKGSVAPSGSALPGCIK